MRRISRTINRLFLPALLISAPACAADASRTPTDEALRYYRPQQMVVVEGQRRMNLYCVGSGEPTVVFDSGEAEGTVAWEPVQDAIAKGVRACAYDRAGIGFSDPASRPGTSANIVDDLHRLLKAAEIAPPYVLVGHSSGGLNVRLFASTFPAAVAGMVLVDPTHEDQREAYRKLDSKKRTLEEWVKLAEPQREFLRGCATAAEAGFVVGSELYKNCVGEPDPTLSAAANAEYKRLALNPAYWLAWLSENESIFGISADQVRASNRSLGDMRLIILTRSPDIAKQGGSQNQETLDTYNAMRFGLHEQIAALSSNSTHSVVSDTRHCIQCDKPDVVIGAVLDVVNAVKTSGSVSERNANAE